MAMKHLALNQNVQGVDLTIEIDILLVRMSIIKIKTVLRAEDGRQTTETNVVIVMVIAATAIEMIMDETTNVIATSTKEVGTIIIAAAAIESREKISKKRRIN